MGGGGHIQNYPKLRDVIYGWFLCEFWSSRRDEKLSLSHLAKFVIERYSIKG